MDDPTSLIWRDPRFMQTMRGHGSEALGFTPCRHKIAGQIRKSGIGPFIDGCIDVVAVNGWTIVTDNIVDSDGIHDVFSSYKGRVKTPIGHIKYPIFFRKSDPFEL